MLLFDGSNADVRYFKLAWYEALDRSQLRPTINSSRLAFPRLLPWLFFTAVLNAEQDVRASSPNMKPL